MPGARVIYARSHSPLGWLIRNADRWGRWSHCGLVTPDDTVIEATFWHGVAEVPFEAFRARYHTTEMYEVSVPAPADAVAWARQQVGLPYDTWAVLGNLARESWQDPGAWQCAELVEAALAAGGAQRFRGDTPWRISPNLSYMVT